MPERWGIWSQAQRTREALIGKIPGGLFPGLLGRDPAANRNLSRALSGFEFQVEIERRRAREQDELIYQAEVSGRPANTGQPLNPHALLYLTSQPDRQKVIYNNPSPPQNQTWGDVARAALAAKGIITQ